MTNNTQDSMENTWATFQQEIRDTKMKTAYTDEQMKDVKLYTIRPEAEPRAVQVDAWIGDLYLGQRTYYASTVKNAKSMALRYIRHFGSLN